MNETSFTQAICIVSVLLGGFVLACFVLVLAEAYMHKREQARLAKENEK